MRCCWAAAGWQRDEHTFDLERPCTQHAGSTTADELAMGAIVACVPNDDGWAMKQTGSRLGQSPLRWLEVRPDVPLFPAGNAADAGARCQLIRPQAPGSGFGRADFQRATSSAARPP